MKRALLKDSLKEIKKSYKRFLSILVMALLGVGFFAGLRATSPDMVDTIDTYFKEQNVYDIQVVSTLGLTNDDINALENIDNVEKVYGTYSKDGLINIDQKEIVSKVMCIDEVNVPKLIEGNLPKEVNECVVEEQFLKDTNKKIGDIITIEIENVNNLNGEEIEYLKYKDMKIVGTVISPLYISRDKGTTNLGSGKINNYIYINKDNINLDVYTEIYVKVSDSEKYTTSSSEYEEYILDIKNNIEDIKEERENARYSSLVADANAKIEEAEKEFNDEKANAEEKIKEAEDKIKEGEQEITDGENELEKNEQNVYSKFSNAEKELNNAKAELENNKEEYNNKKEDAENGFKLAEEQKTSLESQLTSVNDGLVEVENQYNLILTQLENPNLPEEQIAILEQNKLKLEKQKEELQNNKTSIEAGIKKIDDEIANGKEELLNAENLIKEAEEEIKNQESLLQTEKNNAYYNLRKAGTDLENAKEELEEGKKELEENKKEFEQKIAEAEEKLIDARDEVSKIEKAKWYILDRNQNIGYNSFIQDTESVANLSLMFPIVFFAIAILVSLTSMTRMVEEQRQEIGTLKALGYNKFQISFKYIIYSSLACVIGGIIGMNIGFQLLPRIIWKMYTMMYIMPDMIIKFNYMYAIIGLGLIYLCIVGATVYAAIKELLNVPAVLLRPKAPKNGKRVLLERISPIWKRLNFSQKVTVRNIFRYKKRFLMTIIGIFGCTSLILSGFGLKDSISKILPNQYERVFNYDMQITLKSSLEEEQINNIYNKLNDNENTNKIVETYMLSGSAVKNESKEDVYIVIPKESESLNDVINLIDVKSKENLVLNNEGVYITDKLAQLLDLKVGDMILIEDSDNKQHEFKISNIVENYVMHYVYIPKDLYEKTYNESYNTNVLLVKNNNLTSEQEESFSKEILEEKEVSSITLTSTLMKTLDDTMSSLNYVVLILIVSAGLLAFVVLYNLANVNISERIRELATIKVLGFYDKEVYNYVTRETVLLTVIGILLGLVGGYFLNFYIIGTCEIDMLRFVKTIDFISYIYAIIITLVFTIIVNIITYFSLKKIDMISSLKSVE